MEPLIAGRSLIWHGLSAPLGQMSNLLGRFNHALASYKNLEKLFGSKSLEKMRYLNIRNSNLEGIYFHEYPSLMKMLKDLLWKK